MALSEALLTLAATAGSGLVGAAMTDAWTSTKQRFASLISGDSERKLHVIEGRLDSTRDALAAADSDHLDQVRQQHELMWQVRFEDLLEEQPEVATALEQLLSMIRHEMGGSTISAGDGGLAVGGSLSNTATSGGVAAGVITGSVSTSNPQNPGRTDA